MKPHQTDECPLNTQTAVNTSHVNHPRRCLMMASKRTTAGVVKLKSQWWYCPSLTVFRFSINFSMGSELFIPYAVPESFQQEWKLTILTHQVRPMELNWKNTLMHEYTFKASSIPSSLWVIQSVLAECWKLIRNSINYDVTQLNSSTCGKMPCLNHMHKYFWSKWICDVFLFCVGGWRARNGRAGNTMVRGIIRIFWAY